MTTINLKLTLQLNEDEYFKVGDHIFTTNENLNSLEYKLHFYGDSVIKIFKEHEDVLTMKIMEDLLTIVHCNNIKKQLLPYRKSLRK